MSWALCPRKVVLHAARARAPVLGVAAPAGSELNAAAAAALADGLARREVCASLSCAPGFQLLLCPIGAVSHALLAQALLPDIAEGALLVVLFPFADAPALLPALPRAQASTATLPPPECGRGSSGAAVAAEHSQRPHHSRARERRRRDHSRSRSRSRDRSRDRSRRRSRSRSRSKHREREALLRLSPSFPAHRRHPTSADILAARLRGCDTFCNSGDLMARIEAARAQFARAPIEERRPPPDGTLLVERAVFVDNLPRAVRRKPHLLRGLIRLL